MEYVYIIFAEAAFRHGCFGIFSDQEKAEAAANSAAAMDVDDHHTYTVYRFPFGVSVANMEGITRYAGWYNEDGLAVIVYEVHRSTAIARKNAGI